jgi:hypothetical protein
MSKRSNFERREADFYPTPANAVLPLIPYLRVNGIQTFAEPCCGQGDLVRHLEIDGAHSFSIERPVMRSVAGSYCEPSVFDTIHSRHGR